MKALATLAALLGMAGGAWAQSLLGDGGASPYDPAKRLPHKKHDHIRITVTERARALAGAELRTDRRSRWEVDLDEWVQFDRKNGKGSAKLKAGELAGDPGIDLDARFRQDNLGRTSRQFDLTFTITAEVIDVRPNGNLVLQAIKRRKVNADEEVIKLTGEVAPQAVLNGAVRSDSIANLNVSYDATGSVGDVVKPGWLGYILSKLWPF